MAMMGPNQNLPVPAIADDDVTVYLGDCVDVLAGIPDASIDAVICDPPYGLGFMGKDWDSLNRSIDGSHPMRRSAALDAVNAGNTRQGGRQRASEDYAKRQARDARSYGEWCESWAVECLRVLKPGGHLLAFGGTRTYHRIACAVEDVGFEVRDSIAWLYGSGFPKSVDVSRGIDKAAGVEREIVDTYERSGRTAGMRGETTVLIREVTAPASEDAKRWEGWGTALKPAHEPIVVARKSLIGTVVANVLKHGTGAVNVDGCRVATSEPFGGGSKATSGFVDGYEHDGWTPGSELGRWPTNVLLDEDQADALDKQTGTLKSGANPTRRGSDKFRDAYGDFAGQEECEPARGADEGGASRFFPVFRYEAKAGDDERPRVGNLAHPTVKPVDLMRWLVRLVTPPGGVVLDPFLGSGTTAEACIAEGRRCIGIEREDDYLKLIQRRLEKPIAVAFDFDMGVA